MSISTKGSMYTIQQDRSHRGWWATGYHLRYCRMMQNNAGVVSSGITPKTWIMSSNRCSREKLSFLLWYLYSRPSKPFPCRARQWHTSLEPLVSRETTYFLPNKLYHGGTPVLLSSCCVVTRDMEPVWLPVILYCYSLIIIFYQVIRPLLMRGQSTFKSKVTTKEPRIRTKNFSADVLSKWRYV